MHHCHIDIETFSSIDLAKSGVQRYTEVEDFEILLFGYSLDGGPVEVIDLTKQDLPADLIGILHDPDWLKYAFNASFEWTCLNVFYGPLPIDQWRDTRFLALYCGFPASLKDVGAAIGLPPDQQKLKTGTALINYFCKPCSPTKSNGGRLRNLPHHDPAKWDLFIEYNRQDVVTEMEIGKRLASMPPPDWLQKQWETDMLINARGVAVDMELVQGALGLIDRETDCLASEQKELTGIEKQNSLPQLSEWITKVQGVRPTSLDKENVETWLKKKDLKPEVRRVLEIRQELGKTSTAKYAAIANTVCSDHRVHGMLQFYKANRSGRWAGAIIQPQNLARTYIQPLDLARELVKDEDADAIKMIYGSLMDTLSQLVRTSLVVSEGHVMIDADFSAIEARVLAWLAGEEWALEEFRGEGLIYEATAAMMFHVDKQDVRKGGKLHDLRAKGKVATLACGYGGGVSSMIAMGALSSGIPKSELPGIVKQWRMANPCIVRLWSDVESAALYVIKNGGSRVVYSKVHSPNLARVNEEKMGANPGTYSDFFKGEPRFTISKETDSNTSITFMTIQLPSGRKLYYADPKIGTNRFGGKSIIYTGVSQTSKKWTEIETYGARLVENVTQAIARDCLATAIDNLEAAGFPIVFHIHDEVVIDIKPFAEPDVMLKAVTDIMTKPIPWAPGLPLNADGWVGQYFRKD